MHDKLAPVTLKLVIILAIIIDDHMTIPDRYTVHVQSLTEAPSHIRLSLKVNYHVTVLLLTKTKLILCYSVHCI